MWRRWWHESERGEWWIDLAIAGSALVWLGQIVWKTFS